MVDDLRPARPQSGYTDASVVWQAPAEGGIPRYMMVFGEGDPPAVGPVRSARQYYIAWAAEWDALYVHVGGSPQALATLRSQGRGQLVYNADEFRWGGRFLWRVKFRYSPHNVYSDGKHLRALVKAVGAKDFADVPAPVWRFAQDAPLGARPVGGRIVVPYPQNVITYAYDRTTNTYPRTVTGEKRQVDGTTKQRVAPKNVVIMFMHFGPLNDGSHKGRLEADVVGSGVAYVATNGTTIKGTWKKTAMDAPTRFYDADGDPITMTVGQTFVQVVPKGTRITIADGDGPPTVPGPPGMTPV